MTNSADKQAPAFGAMASVVKDQLYLTGYGHIYTTPHMNTAGVVRRSATILLTVKEGSFELHVGRHTERYRAATVKPMAKRGLRTENVPLATVMVNPLHPRYPAFRTIPAAGFLELPREKFAPYDAALAEAYAGTLQDEPACALYEDVIRLTADCLPPAPPVDPRVEIVRDIVHRHANISRDELTAAVGLSYSRVSHLFTDCIGLSLRSYLLWLKMHIALMSLHSGRSLTDVARAAGFTDLAHFSRTMQQAFGAPVTYFWDTTKVQMHFCSPDLAELARARRNAAKASTG